VGGNGKAAGMSKASEDFLARRADDPDPLLADLKSMLRQHHYAHPRNLQIQLGPSEVGHPCSRKLAQGLLEMPAVNSQYDPLPSYIGVAAHARMEEAARHDNSMRAARGEPIRWIPEQKVWVRQDLSGTCDLYDIERHTVIDYKFPGTTAMTEYRKNGPSQTYRVQAHLYGRGYVRLGLPVKQVGIWFLPRGGQLANSLLWLEDYSDAIVDKTLDHISNVLILAQDLDVENHPDRWQWFPRVADHCSYCPYFTVQQGHSDPCACTGSGPTRTDATTA
jgi:hypothetical protein